MITLTYSAFSVELGQGTAFSGVRANGQAPLTYQWIEQGANNTTVVLNDGATANGSTLSGTTTLTLFITGTTAADAGAYAIQVTDANGYTTTSAWMSLTVKAAAAPAITSQPVNATTIAGNNASFTVAASGSYPRTYQWYKGTPPSGTAIAGATGYPFTITGAMAGDAGSYYVTVTNAYGTATSNAANLTVNPATPISYAGSNSSQTAYVGQSVTFSQYPNNGSGPITYQWQKDGTPIAGATSPSYSINPLALTNTGTYTELATNAAGSVTSPSITLTVNPAIPPTITTPPASASVGQNNYVQFSVTVSGSTPLTFQWLKNGTPIAGATNSGYTISSVQPSDAASYTVTVTNAGGSVTSAPATLTVLPPIAASFYGSVFRQSANLGSALSLSIQSQNYNGAVGPFTYQWYKNGAAIAGATSSTYTIANTQLADAGTYDITVTNPGGTVAAPPTEVTITAPNSGAAAWLDAVQQGSIIYFLFASHIERFDLSSGTWLSTVSLTQTATAFCVASDGAYVAFGRAVAKFPLDFSSQTTLANLGANVTSMFSFGNFIYAATAGSPFDNIYPIDRSTGAVGSTALTLNLSGAASYAIDAAANKIYTPASAFGAQITTVDATGAFSGGTLRPYGGTFIRGNRGYLMPDQQHFADNGGSVFNVSDGKIAATFGSQFTDLTFLPDGTPVVLRDNLLYTYAVGGMKEIAHTALSASGTRVFASGTNVFVFYPGTSSGNSYVGLTQVAATAISSPYPNAPAANATGLSFAATATLQDNAGVVYLYDAAHENLYRWSPTSLAYLAPIPLTGAPKQVVYSSTLNAIYCVYLSGRITKIDLNSSSPTEQAFSAFPNSVITVTGADKFLFAILQNGQDSGENQTVLDGSTGAIVTITGSSYFSTVYTWSSANQSLYPSQGSYYPIQPLTSTGALPNSDAHFSQSASGTVFASADGTRLIAAGGQAFDATGFYLGVLGNAVTEIAFLGDTPYSIRSDSTANTEVQAWSPTSFVLNGSTTLPGLPVRLLALGSNQLLVVTQSGGVPTYTILNASLQRVSTTASAGTSSTAPVFIAQPAASVAAYAGANVTLAVDTNGATPQTFQWYKNGTAISGATASSLQLSSVGSTDAANYYVTATNNVGSTTSNTTTLSVAPAMSFTTQPQSQTAAVGASVTFQASVANATGAAYQWYYNGTAISGATSNALVISPVATNSSFGSYVLKVSNTAGAIYSTPATLAAATPAPTITAQPTSFVAALGNSASFGVSGQNVTSYQWYFQGSPIAGATSGTYSIPVVTAANVGTYYVVLTGAGGSTTSNSVSLSLQTSTPAAPVITGQPASASVTLGTALQLTVTATNATSYQWYFNGTAIAGATNSTLTLDNVTTANAGSYTVTVTGPGGSVTSNAAVVSLNASTSYAGTYFGTIAGGGSWAMWVPASGYAKFIAYLPQNSGALLGDLVVDGTGAISLHTLSGYSKSYSGVTLPTAMSGQISSGNVTGTLNNAGGAMTGSVDTGTAFPSLAGFYTLGALVADSGQSYAVVGGSGTMLAIWVNFQAIGTQPDSVSGQLTGDPEFTGTTALGRSATVALDANTGAITETLAASTSTTVAFGGLPATTTNTARLVNLSARADVGTGTDVLITGFAIQGDSSQTKRILVRGVGPSMKIFQLSDPLADPQLTFNDGSGTKLWTGTNWGGSTALATTFTSVGAFPLDPTSADSAQTFTVHPGNYTAIVSGAASDTGIALAEIYDTDTGTNGPRLINLSARANVQPGAGVLTAGLVIGGTGPETVLLRGIGPTMKVLGVSDYLASPQLTLYDAAQHPIATNTGWSDSGYTTNYLMSQVGAFQLPDGSADCVIRATLMPGNYTVQVTSRDGSTGVALVEVYEVR